jgi:2-hydroxychromene-2-carboxylate isomerase
MNVCDRRRTRLDPGQAARGDEGRRGLRFPDAGIPDMIGAGFGDRAMATIDYFLFPLSPYGYLAGLGLEQVAARRGAEIVYRPVQLFRIFEAVGTPKVADRHPAKQAYRLADLARVARLAGLPINLRPAFWPTNAAPASAAIIAAQAAGGGDLGGLVHAFGRAVWAEDRDIADDAVVRDILNAHGFEPGVADRGLLGSMETLERNTEEALRRGVFGAPTYAVGEELFWGQDRLPHLDAHLAGGG